MVLRCRSVEDEHPSERGFAGWRRPRARRRRPPARAPPGPPLRGSAPSPRARPGGRSGSPAEDVESRQVHRADPLAAAGAPEEVAGPPVRVDAVAGAGEQLFVAHDRRARPRTRRPPAHSQARACPAEAATSQNAEPAAVGRRDRRARGRARAPARPAADTTTSPEAARTAAGEKSGRTRSSARTPWRSGGSPVARSVQISGGEAGRAGHHPAAPLAKSSARSRPASASVPSVEPVHRQHDDGAGPRRRLGGGAGTASRRTPSNVSAPVSTSSAADASAKTAAPARREGRANGR